jgi:glycosyltransferase involved in cell wall biosynthesis
MQEIFSVSRILLDPSLMEGLGLIPLEAAAAGVVSIITKRHSYEGLFKDNGFPFIEIDDFQMPNNVFDAIEKAMSMNPKVISDSVKNLNWKNGSLHFVNVVKEFLTN